MATYPGQKGYYVGSFSGKAKASGNPFTKVDIIEVDRESGKISFSSLFPEAPLKILENVKPGTEIEFTLSISSSGEKPKLVSVDKILTANPFFPSSKVV